MYTVYSDTTLIHDGTSPDLDIHLIDPTLTIGDSVAGSFDMTVPPNNPGYSVINRFTSIIYVKRDNVLMWKGRVLTENQDLWNRRKFTTEGALAFLNDTNQEMKTYANVNLQSFIATLLDVHNSKVSTLKQFRLGMITVNDLDDDHVYQTNYGNTWEEFKTNCLDRLNGHVRLRYGTSDDIPYFDYLGEYPNTASQEINFGHNLLDFTRDWDASDIATVIIPRGKQLDEEDDNGQRQYLTVESVNGGSIYVFNQDAYNTFGRVEEIVDFSEVDEPNTLLQLARVYISVQQFDSLTMTVNAIDLHKLVRNTAIYVEDQDLNNILDSNNNSISGYLVGIHDKYKDVTRTNLETVIDQNSDFILDSSNNSISSATTSIVSEMEQESNYVAFELLDEVRCISKPHGLDRMFPISEMKIPLEKPDGVTYTMGRVDSKSMTNSNMNRTSAVLNRIKNLPSTTNILGLAKQQAAQILNQRTTGYVTITEVDESSEAIIISNTRDWQNATKRWMFNMNGLGYTRDQGQTYDIAITMDGTIVADFIKTGVLEDGYGLNWWNMSTGEFSLAWNTEFRNITGDVLTIVDVNELANTANDAAESAQDFAEGVQVDVNTQAKKQSGSTNLINGTNTLHFANERPHDSSWDMGTWETGTNCGCRIAAVDVDNPPNQKIKKGALFEIHQQVENPDVNLRQRDVPLGNEQVYCISCYARGNGKLQLKVGREVDGKPMYAAATKPVYDEWKRYHLVFGTGLNNTYSDSKYIAGIIANRVDVIFGSASDVGTSVYVCGMKVERGNDPTDWGESDFDIQVLANEYTNKSAEKVKEAAVEYADAQIDKLETFTREYVSTISDNDREFTKAQRQALDESFTQSKVLKRLTNNYQAKGIYLQNNQLYMNATYIRTGTLDAGIVKTGILTDAQQQNKWNMLTGYLYTKNMEAVNAKINGRFECGSSHKLELANGKLYGYQGTQYIGSIDYTARMYNIDNQRNYNGLMLRASGGMQIRTPAMAIRRANDDGIATTCFTGRKEFEFAWGLQDRGNGSLGWTSGTHGIEVINGLVVSVW